MRRIAAREVGAGRRCGLPVAAGKAAMLVAGRRGLIVDGLRASSSASISSTNSDEERQKPLATVVVESM
jgi:hypothetical protein